MGRRKGSSPLLTDDVLKNICALLSRGISANHAAEANGVDEMTFHSWMRKGQDGTEPYASFRKAITRARALGAINLHDKALQGGKGCMSAQFMLERRYRDEYGPRQRIEHSGPDGNAIEITAKAVREMTDEELQRLADSAGSLSGTRPPGD